jgi:hypothetical protein
MNRKEHGKRCQQKNDQRFIGIRRVRQRKKIEDKDQQQKDCVQFVEYGKVFEKLFHPLKI